MWYCYVLKSRKNESLYTGFTNDLKRRFLEHNQKRGGAYSQCLAPFDLIFYEAYIEKDDATKAEKFFKSGYGREVLKDKLSNYFKTINR
jgi:putative endonuclease